MTIELTKVTFGVAAILAAAALASGCAVSSGAAEDESASSAAIEESACANMPVTAAGGAFAEVKFDQFAPNGEPCGTSSFDVVSSNASYGNISCLQAYLVDVALIGSTSSSRFQIGVTDLTTKTEATCANARFTIDVYADNGPEVLKLDDVAGQWSDGVCVATADVSAAYSKKVGRFTEFLVAKTLRLSVNAVSPKPTKKITVITPDIVEVRGGSPTCIF